MRIGTSHLLPAESHFFIYPAMGQHNSRARSRCRRAKCYRSRAFTLRRSHGSLLAHTLANYSPSQLAYIFCDYTTLFYDF